MVLLCLLSHSKARTFRRKCNERTDRKVKRAGVRLGVTVNIEHIKGTGVGVLDRQKTALESGVCKGASWEGCWSIGVVDGV